MAGFHLLPRLLLRPYYTAAVILFIIHAPPVASLSFNFNFSTGDYASELNYSGDSYWAKPVVELTKDHRYEGINNSVGRVWYARPVPLWDRATRELASFNTTFSFQINSGDNVWPADGMAFFLGYYPSVTPANSGGGRLGLFSGGPNINKSATGDEQVVAVEFDTFRNIQDSSSNHVGIDINSIISVASKDTDLPGKNLSSGLPMTARVSYHNDTMLLSVDLQIDDALYHVSTNVDLRDCMPEAVAVGFSAATGDLVELHQLLSWSFNSSDLEGAKKPTATENTFAAAAPALQGHEERAHKLRLRPERLALIIVSGLLGLMVFFVTAFTFKRIFHWCQELETKRQCCGPRQYQYCELDKATNGFDPQRKLGRGGSGEVYLGNDKGRQIAVKVLSEATDDEDQMRRREFEAEVNIISTIRHKNLVRLIGWCDSSNRLLLVYEYIAGGSLDNHLYSIDRSLSWNDRYKIIVGLGKALGYLHGEHSGTTYVVHGDIKPSNIMLDEAHNPKLGDFGTARLRAHGAALPTTEVVKGTHGYVEPQYVETGKKCKESDVYSFGIVLLEMVTGHGPRSLPLAAWVCELHRQNRVLDAASTTLRSEANDQQMERVLVVGLWCTAADRIDRPPVAQAMSIWEHDDVPLPVLPACRCHGRLTTLVESPEQGRVTTARILAPSQMSSNTAPVADLGGQAYSSALPAAVTSSSAHPSSSTSTSYNTCSIGTIATTSLGVDQAPTGSSVRGN